MQPREDFSQQDLAGEIHSIKKEVVELWDTVSNIEKGQDSMHDRLIVIEEQGKALMAIANGTDTTSTTLPTAPTT